MTHKHLFLISAHKWDGEGTIKFNMSSEVLVFTTTWQVSHNDDGTIHCKQDICIKDVPETMANSFVISDLSKEKFLINLNNEILGSVDGSGIIDEKLLAWEFRGNELDFEGYEIFEKQDEKSYLTRAEFTSKDQMRTMIEGKIWLSNSSQEVS